MMVWGAVVDESGLCIIGATVEVVSGQGLGARMTQVTLCDAWEPYGGFVFNGLTAGVMTIRASASGYVAREVTVMPSGVPVIVDLSKIPGTADPATVTTDTTAAVWAAPGSSMSRLETKTRIFESLIPHGGSAFYRAVVAEHPRLARTTRGHASRPLPGNHLLAT
jgi:hypothetical protein